MDVGCADHRRDRWRPRAQAGATVAQRISHLDHDRRGQRRRGDRACRAAQPLRDAIVMADGCGDHAEAAMAETGQMRDKPAHRRRMVEADARMRIAPKHIGADIRRARQQREELRAMPMAHQHHAVACALPSHPRPRPALSCGALRTSPQDRCRDRDSVVNQPGASLLCWHKGHAGHGHRKSAYDDGAR